MSNEFTVDQKYQFLLSKLKISFVDVLENDALINLQSSIYFQFSSDDEQRVINNDVDYAISQAIISDNWDKQNKEEQDKILRELD